MDPNARERWQSEVLDAILEAFAASQPLASCLIFKGGRVLSRRLNEPKRKSLDIDANLDQRFADKQPDRSAQQEYLHRQMVGALREHFGGQEPVRFELVNVKVEPKPREVHPRGWNAFLVSISVKDLTKAGVRSLPSLTLVSRHPRCWTWTPSHRSAWGGTKSWPTHFRGSRERSSAPS